MEALTIKQTLDQGYRMYGFGSREWQGINEIHDDLFDEIEEEEWEDVVLFEKTSSTPSISSTDIAEMLAERIYEDDNEVCARQDDIIYDTVKAMDFKKTAEMINKELEQHKYWLLTDIKLTK